MMGTCWTRETSTSSRALQEDARATYADVAARVGLSASAVHDRVRKLEQQR